VDEEALAEALAPEVRRERGAYFTPRTVVERTLELVAPYVPARGSLSVIDPACGAGAFLSAAQERWPRAALRGVELEAASAAACRARVPKARVVEGDAIAGDALEQVLARIPESGFELWLGNPPYNGTSPLLKNESALARALSFGPPGLELPSGRSLREDFVFFLLRASHRLAERNGALAFVTSATLLDAFLYAPIRRVLLSRLALREVVDLGGGVFRGARVRTCVTVWTSAKEKGARPRSWSGDASAPFAPSEPTLELRPLPAQAEALERRWRASGEPLNELVPVSFPGLKTRFDELLVDDDPTRLFERVREFLACGARELDAFARRWRLDRALWPKLRVTRRLGAEAVADRVHVRRFLRYRGPLEMGAPAWCYVDRRLIPRGDHRFRGDYDPHAHPVKLVFNVHELPLWSRVLSTPGCVTAYRHSRFAPLMVPWRIRDEGLGVARMGETLGPLVPNLSARGLAWAKRLGGAQQAFDAIARFLTSREVQEIWAPAYGASRVVHVPLS
jgi:hypothetical protein